ncbi:MAG: hypothetical protein K6356_03615 [Chloroflexus sp.]
MHHRSLRLLLPFTITLGLIALLPPLPVQAAGEAVLGELNGWSTSWSMSASLGGSFIYVSGQITTSNDTESEFKFYKSDGGGQWFGKDAPNHVTFGQIFTGLSTGGGSERNLRFNHIQDSFYVFKWDGGSRGVVFRLTAAPVTVVSVSRTPAVPLASQPVTVTATTSGVPPAEQALWLRYAINNNWASSTVIKMSGSGTTFSATIPA